MTQKEFELEMRVKVACIEFTLNTLRNHPNPTVAKVIKKAKEFEKYIKGE
jgi:hypothetical protein